jgi:hypothetical protein
MLQRLVQRVLASHGAYCKTPNEVYHRRFPDTRRLEPRRYWPRGSPKPIVPPPVAFGTITAERKSRKRGELAELPSANTREHSWLDRASDLPQSREWIRRPSSKSQRTRRPRDSNRQYDLGNGGRACRGQRSLGDRPTVWAAVQGR